MIDSDASLEQVQRIFSNDRFATETTGCRVVEAGPGHAVCELDVCERHLNEKGGVMGGAIFTLADFACAVACGFLPVSTAAIFFRKPNAIS